MQLLEDVCLHDKTRRELNSGLNLDLRTLVTKRCLPELLQMERDAKWCLPQDSQDQKTVEQLKPGGFALGTVEGRAGMLSFLFFFACL